jgi:predicted MPP superfamily phosphohydrolase
VVGIVAYGAWNSRQIHVTRYDITIPKKAGNLKSLHIVGVSDIHLGTIIHNGRLTKMVDTINGLNPDLVFLAGDIVDEDIESIMEKQMMETIKDIKAKKGVFAVPGNHEYISGKPEETFKYLEEAGVKVLRDSYVKVEDSFYVVGRDEGGHGALPVTPRKEIPQILEGVDTSLPVLLMQHQPLRKGQPAPEGIDLQLSGHTHHGQLFPNQFVTGRMYAEDWGLKRMGNFNLIVSSGIGTWGPPIRVGNHPEIVDMHITFAQ